MSSVIKFTRLKPWLVTFLFCLPFLSNSKAADTEIRRLLEASIKKAINAASEGGLESKDMEEITLLFEFDETKKILAEDSSLFEFLAEKPITRLRPDGLTPDQLNAARKLDARKSLMVEFLVKNGAGKALQAKNGQFRGAEYIEVAAKAAGSQSVKALLEAGCDSQIKRQAGTPALTAAAGNAWLFPESVPLLLKAGASALGGDDSTAEPLSALLQNYCDSITYFPPAAVARLTPTEAALIVGNCETTVSLLIKSQASVSNALKVAIEKGYSKAVTAMLASPQAPESGTMLKWLISAKLSNVNYDPASFASIRDAISKHKEQMATGGSAATAEGAQKLGLPLVRAFFHGGTKTEGSELWTTDGTADGTKMVADLEPGSGSSDLKHFVPVEGGMAFIGSTREKKLAVYRVDNGGTTVDSMMWEHNVSEVGSAENRMVLFDNRPPKQIRGLGLLWQSDGTPNGTFPIAHDKLKIRQVDPRSNRFFFWMDIGPTFKEGWMLAELKPSQRQIVQHAKVMNLPVFENSKFLAGPEHFIWFNELGMWSVKQGSAALPDLLFGSSEIGV